MTDSNKSTAEYHTSSGILNNPKFLKSEYFFILGQNSPNTYPTVYTILVWLLLSKLIKDLNKCVHVVRVAGC